MDIKREPTVRVPHSQTSLVTCTGEQSSVSGTSHPGAVGGLHTCPVVIPSHSMVTLSIQCWAVGSISQSSGISAESVLLHLTPHTV